MKYKIIHPKIMFCGYLTINNPNRLFNKTVQYTNLYSVLYCLIK